MDFSVFTGDTVRSLVVTIISSGRDEPALPLHLRNRSDDFTIYSRFLKSAGSQYRLLRRQTAARPFFLDHRNSLPSSRNTTDTHIEVCSDPST